MRVHVISNIPPSPPQPFNCLISTGGFNGGWKGVPPLNLTCPYVRCCFLLGPNETAPILWIIHSFPSNKIFTRQSRMQVSFCVLSMCTHKTQRTLMKETLVSMKGIYFSPNHVCYDKVSVTRTELSSLHGEGCTCETFSRIYFVLYDLGTRGLGGPLGFTLKDEFYPN